MLIGDEPDAISRFQAKITAGPHGVVFRKRFGRGGVGRHGILGLFRFFDCGQRFGKQIDPQQRNGVAGILQRLERIQGFAGPLQKDVILDARAEF